MLRLCNPFAVEQQVIPSVGNGNGKKYLLRHPSTSTSFADHTVYEHPEQSLYDADDGEMDARPRPVDSVRHKPVLGRQSLALSLSLSPHAPLSSGASFRISTRAKTLRAVEDEIYLLTLDLKWIERRYAEYEQQMLVAAGLPAAQAAASPAVGAAAAPGALSPAQDSVFLCYECEQALPAYPHNLAAFQSPLVLVLRSTLARRPYAATTAQALQQLLAAMAALHFLVENYQELPPNFDAASPYNHNCLGSVEFAFVFADVLMAGNLLYLIQVHDSQEKSLGCLYGLGNGNGSGSGNGGAAANSDNSGAQASVHQGAGQGAKQGAPGAVERGGLSFIRHMQNLVVSLTNIVHYADEKTRTPSLIAYSHMLIKLCKVLGYLLMIFEQRCEEMLRDFRNYYDSFHELVALVGSVVPCFQTIKMFLNNESIYYYILSVRFWHVSEQLVWLLYRFLNRLPATPPSPYRAMFMLWKEKVLGCVYTILPLPSEFFFELQRMESRRQNVLGLSDDFLFDTLIEDLLRAPETTNSGRGIGESGAAVLAATKRAVQGLLPPKSSPPSLHAKTHTHAHTHAQGAAIKVDVMSFHARFLLIGMVRMLQLHPSHSLGASPTALGQHYSNAVSIPLRDKYFTVLHEILFHLLEVTVEKKGLFKPHLLPIIAHMLMKLSVGMTRSPSTDWAFWKMAKEMAKFNEYLRRRRAQQQALQQAAQAYFPLAQSRGSYSSRSHDAHSTVGRTPSHRLGGAASRRSPTADLLADSPFKDMRASPSPRASARKQFVSIAAAERESFCVPPVALDALRPQETPQCSAEGAVFSVGDAVDALCTLANGSQRWFPGTVTGRSARNTYDVLFADGDRVADRAAADLRVSKQRRRPTRPAAERETEREGDAHSAPLGALCASERSCAEETRAAPGASLFSVGDAVDALCSLSNGTQRWYPGTVEAVSVTALSAAFSYSILFDDGDRATDKPERDVRATKQRRARGRGRNGSEQRPQDREREEREGEQPTSPSHNALPQLTLSHTPPTHSHTHALEHTRPSFAKQPLATILSVGRFPPGQLPLDGLASTANASRETEAEAEARRASADEELLGTREIVRVQSGDLYDAHSDEEDDDEDGLVFNIPSVFATDRDQDMQRRHVDVIPKMQLLGIPMTSALPQLSAQPSLSCSIVYDDAPGCATPLLSSPSPSVRKGLSLGVPSLKIGSALRVSVLGSSNPHTQRSVCDLGGAAPYGAQDEPHGSRAAQALLSLSGKACCSPSLNLGPRFHEIANGAERGAGSGAAEDAALLSGNTRLQSWRPSHTHSHSNSSASLTLLAAGAQDLAMSARTGRSAKHLAPLSTHRLAPAGAMSSARSDLHPPALLHPSTAMAAIAAKQPLQPLGPYEDRDGACVSAEEMASYLEREEMFSEETTLIVQYLLDTYAVLSLVLLRHCLLQSDELDYACCSENLLANDAAPLPLNHGTHTASQVQAHTLSHTQRGTPSGIATSTAGTGTALLSSARRPLISDATNVLFILREHLELTANTENKRYMAAFALFLPAGVYRLLKLLSSLFFDCCLRQHMQQGECASKIGEGGFGAVYRVTCPADCNRFHSYSHCFACYQRENYLHCILAAERERERDKAGFAREGEGELPSCRCWRTTRCLETDKTRARERRGLAGLLSAPHAAPAPSIPKSLLIDRTFAVKRITRERSVHDESVAFSLFQEISSLEKMRDCIGVCGLEDYGVDGATGEYWLVLEAGRCDLAAWRHDFRVAKERAREKARRDRAPHGKARAERERERESEREQRSVRGGESESERETSCVDERGASGGEDESGSRSLSRDAESEDFHSEQLCLPRGAHSHNTHTQHAPGTQSVQRLERQDLLLFLVLFLDVLLVVRDVHSQDIAHFDLKASNLVLREDPVPLLSSIVVVQQTQRKASGILFLADFGEAIVNISTLSRPAAVRHRARGTLCVQSPEMLAVSGLARGAQAAQAAAMQTDVTLGDVLLRSRGSFSRNSFSLSSHGNAQLNNDNNGTVAAAAALAQAAPSGRKKQFSLPDQRSDIWSLGCLFFEILTGRMLFADASWPELFTKFCLEPAPIASAQGGAPGSAAGASACALGDAPPFSAHPAIENLLAKFAAQHTHTPGAQQPQGAQGATATPSALCGRLLTMIDALPLVAQLSDMTLDIQRRVLSLLCRALQPDPARRVALPDLVDLTEDAIAALLAELALVSPANSLGAAPQPAPSASPAVLHGLVSSHGNAKSAATTRRFGLSRQSTGVSALGQAAQANAAAFDDLSFSLSVSLSGWTIDHNYRRPGEPSDAARALAQTSESSARTAHTTHSARTQTGLLHALSLTPSSRLAPSAASTSGSGSGSGSGGADAVQTARERDADEDATVLYALHAQPCKSLSHSLLVKVTDTVFVASRPLLVSLLRQLLGRRQPRTPLANYTDSPRAEDNIADKQALSASRRQLSYYLGSVAHPLDANFRLFRPLYDIQQSIYTQHHLHPHTHSFAVTGSSSAENSHRGGEAADSGRSTHRDALCGPAGAVPHAAVTGEAAEEPQQALENATATELFADLVMFLLQSHGGGSSAPSTVPSNVSGNASTVSGTASVSSSEAPKERRRSFFDKKTRSSSVGDGDRERDRERQRDKKVAAAALKALKSPIVWVRVHACADDELLREAREEDERLAALCGVAVVPVCVQSVALPAGDAAAAPSDATDADAPQKVVKLDFAAVFAAVQEVSKAVHITATARGSAPTVIVTLDDYTERLRRDAALSACRAVPADTTGKPVVQALALPLGSSPPSGAASLAQSLCQRAPYCETLNRVEASFALSVAGFLTHATTRAELEPISLDSAVRLLARLLRVMPWLEDLVDSQLLFSFATFCFRQDYH